MFVIQDLRVPRAQKAPAATERWCPLAWRHLNRIHQSPNQREPPALVAVAGVAPGAEVAHGDLAPQAPQRGRPPRTGTPPAEPACSMALVAASPQAVVISAISWSLAPSVGEPAAQERAHGGSVSGSTGSSTAKLSAIGRLWSASRATSSGAAAAGTRRASRWSHRRSGSAGRVADQVGEPRHALRRCARRAAPPARRCRAGPSLPGRSSVERSSIAREGQHPERHRRPALQELRQPVPADQQRRQVAGVYPAGDALGRIDHHVQEGRHLAVLRLGPDEAVELVDDLGGLVALERVRPQRVAQPAHHRGRGEALAGHVAHHEPHPAAGDRDDVVPVAAHLRLGGGGQVARGHPEPGQPGQAASGSRLRWSVSAMWCSRSYTRACVDRQRHAISGQPQQAQVVVGEAPGR